MNPSSDNVAAPPRRISLRTRGQRHGPITRLVSPGDLGQLLKPFVFLDAFEVEASGAPRFGIHPHSGLATFSYLIEGSFSYEDTTGKTGVLAPGGVEWMRAGRGVWHDGAPVGTAKIKGFQLWVALPPPLETAEPLSEYLGPEQLQDAGPARVLLGSYQGASSLIAPPSPMNYLSVKLEAGTRWRYEPPAGHSVGWVAVHEGRVTAGESIAAGELVVFEAGERAIEFVAEVDTGFVLGSAVPHPHPLVLGRYSVHTRAATLREGEARIVEIGQELRRIGRLR